MDFDGAKLALYFGEFLAVILRDDIPGLLYAGHWDLPGGGREGEETPLACALRECHEELGLAVPATLVKWKQEFREGDLVKWFFVAELPLEAARDIRFGDEGQGWKLMDEETFLGHARAVPEFQERLRIWIAARDSDQSKESAER